ncbi:MAG: HTH-type transcriptional repressor RspR [Chloroflexi bacterium]|nr:HTH-type transcriptional repressor RspR [Chloroflexota bacterium]MBT9165947.1 HTH-type transcriptional repressor RspR [Chloroflexota bacterium]
MISQQRRNCADEVFNRLRQAIISGELRPNQRVVESAIAQKLGISRTPAREGLKQLEMKGYLSRLPTGGLIVTDHSPGQIRNLYEIREAMETMAIRLVCQRVTEEQINTAKEYHARLLETIRNRDGDQFIEFNSAFHTGLLAACGNDQLFSLIQSFRDQYFDRRIARVFTARDWRVMSTEHAGILEAVQERNARRAEKAVRRHLRTALRLALERL